MLEIMYFKVYDDHNERMVSRDKVEMLVKELENPLKMRNPSMYVPRYTPHSHPHLT
jgi:hypothetical protein